MIKFMISPNVSPVDVYFPLFNQSIKLSAILDGNIYPSVAIEYCYSESKDEDEIFRIVKRVSSITNRNDISILGCYIYVLLYHILD